MVRQQREDDMTPETREAANKIRATITNRVDSRNVCQQGKRGIIDLANENDSEHPRNFYLHQTIAVQNLLLKNLKQPYFVRKAAQLWVHDTGMGKTISSVLAIGALHKFVKRQSDFKILIVVPLGVVDIWYQTLKIWTTLGKKIHKATKQVEITASMLETEHVLVTTKDAIVAAYKTFMYWDKRHEEYTTQGGKQKFRAGWSYGVDPRNLRLRAKFPDGRPPKHPLFAYLDKCKTTPIPDVGFNEANPFSKYAGAMLPAWCAGFRDEIHTNSNPKTQHGKVLNLLFDHMVYTVGLTATPVRSKPEQVASICRALNVQGVGGELIWMQEAKNWKVRGHGSHTLRRDTIVRFHDELVDRAGRETVSMTDVKHVLLQFDPFIGRKRDGSYDKEQQVQHNSYLLSAKNVAAEIELVPAGMNRSRDDDKFLWTSFTTMTQMCMSGVLGMAESAKEFETNKRLYSKALKQPSEQMRLIWRMLRDRQQKGHGRIVVYSESVVMLTLLRNQLTVWGSCGRMFLYTGSVDINRRDRMIREFLGPESPRSVLFISSAGALGTTLCPGCDTMFVVGDIPWNHADLQQAHGRVHRINQNMPVEIVQFEPRRSLTSAKLEAHIDKRDRLEPAMRDADFSNFEDNGEDFWRTACAATLNIATVNEQGNYRETAKQTQERETHERECEIARQQGIEPPPMPESLVIPAAVLADDYELPACSFPVEGFVEPPLDDPVEKSSSEDSEGEEEDEQEAKGDKKGKKRPLIVFPSEDEQTAIERRVRQALAMRSRVVHNSSSDEDAMEEDATASDLEGIVDDSEDEDCVSN
jgi:hypothetical protein